MQISDTVPPTTDSVFLEQDLGPLAWVLAELRKSFEGSVKALKLFARDAEQARKSNMAMLDPGPLRGAAQQLHTTTGALEMVGRQDVARVSHAMEGVVQLFVQSPHLCTAEAVNTIERAGLAVCEFLESIMAGKPSSAVGLFSHYRDVQALGGSDSVHPADLWSFDHLAIEPTWELIHVPMSYGPDARAVLDQSILKIVKAGDVQAAGSLRDTSLGFAAAQTARDVRIFWHVCAGFYDALAAGLVQTDLYVKRAVSRVLMQYATFARGDNQVSDRLVHDMLFFCAQAQPAHAGDAPVLEAVRQAYGLQHFSPVNYEERRFGRLDPALLTQARKRIATAAETWSALAGGDRHKLKQASDQFGLVCESLRKLYPGTVSLADALTQVLEFVVLSGEPPVAALAMEVATSVLYLQATFEDMGIDGEQMIQRAEHLAQRLERVQAGGQSEPLEPWMEELYRRVSDRQTMGSVVGELRTSLEEVEKLMDQFFRNTQDVQPLRTVPDKLMQMRGVLSLLGLDQASLAVVRMRSTVEHFLTEGATGQAVGSPALFEKLGNSLGALGFMIDMLSYQRAMARKLFVYDEELGELRLVAKRPQGSAVRPVVPGAVPAVVDTQAPIREEIPALGLPGAVEALLTPAVPAQRPTAAVPAPPPAATVDLDEDDLIDIFLEEAHEVVGNGLAAVDALELDPSDLTQQTTLRRAFHTLKGSSRMVGLSEFGEAAWAMEQLLNAWLAEQKPVEKPLLNLSADALRAMRGWVEDIAEGDDAAWQSQPFRVSADALRLNHQQVALELPRGVADVHSVHVPDLVEAPLRNTAMTAPFGGAAAAAFESTDFLPTDMDAKPQEEAAFDATRPASLLEWEELDFHQVPSVSADPAPEPASELIAALPVPTQEHSEPIPVPEDAVMLSDDSSFDMSEWFSASTASLSTSATPETSAVQSVEDSLPPLATEAETAQMPLPDGWQDFDEVSTEWSDPEPLPVIEPFAAFNAEPVVALNSEVLSKAQEGTPSPDAESFPPIQPVFDPVPVLAAQEPLSAPPSRAEVEDSVKVIGSLRIGIPLYTVYLNEADEWSRHLQTELAEWALELHLPAPEQAVVMAHSLAGSSATVGFRALSELARSLEHALQHVQLSSSGTPEQAQVFCDAAEEIRRLLHQFAAGFLKEPDPQIAVALQAILETEVSSTVSPTWDMQATESVDAKQPEPEHDVEAVAQDDPLSVVSTPVAQEPMDSVVSQKAVMTSVADNIHEDIDAVDVIDPDLFPIFEEEALELLPLLGSAMRQWADQPDNSAVRQQVLRALHTLKGSSRLAGAMRLGELAHRMESAIERLDAENMQSTQVEPLLTHFDNLQTTFDALRVVSAASPDEPVIVPSVPSVNAPPPVAEASSEPVPSEQPSPVRQAIVVSPKALRVHMPVQVSRQAANQTVRVRATLLDRLVNQVGEVMISRSRLDVQMGQMRGSLGELSGNLERLRTQLRDIEVQAESQMQSRLALTKDADAAFDPLEFDRFTRVQELTRMMAESVNDVATVQRSLQRALEGTEDDLIAQGRQARELQRDLLRTRMVEFDSVSERLYAVVRQSAKEAGKQITLDINGGALEIDRGVLDRMTPAFEHLLRNAIVHGIEDTVKRVAQGKPATGKVTIELRQEGNDVSVVLRDDGRGLDLEAIRAKAVERGLVAADADLSEAEAASLVFQSGFSTAENVTELAGRGVGMDVVLTEVQALGGRIETATSPGQGTAFTMVLPLTTAVTQVVMLRMGELSIGVPANVLEVVRRTPAKDVEQAYQTGRFQMAGESIPFFWAGALLQASACSDAPPANNLPVVIFRSAAQRIALHVDEVLGNQDAVVKNLGPQLSRLPGLTGMTVQASGAVVLIYNPVALSTVYGDQARQLTKAHQAHVAGAAVGGSALPIMAMPAVQQVPLIMVVDDSITVRRVTQRLLQREGYRVVLAADGFQALEKLQDERPAVVLSDIEMPRMDGFDLARNIRADASLSGLPIIMITSRIAEKHREHAMELGVNHYLGKPYSEEELLNLVHGYAQLLNTEEAAL